MAASMARARLGLLQGNSPFGRHVLSESQRLGWPICCALRHVERERLIGEQEAVASYSVRLFSVA